MKQGDLNFFIEGDWDPSKDEIRDLKRLSVLLLKSEGSAKPVNVVFTEDAEVRALNAEFRNKDKTTDVLSFPWEDEELLGELFISVPQVLRQAPRFGTTAHEEMRRVLVHGLLHLLEYDHIKPKDRVVMRAKEEEYLGRSPYV